MSENVMAFLKGRIALQGIEGIVEANGRDLEVSDKQRWTVLYVKTGRELLIAKRCLRRGISFFCPLVLDKKTKFLIPLWQNYVFCRLGPKQSKIMGANSVERLLLPPDEDELIRHLKEFGSINCVLHYRENDRVVVRTGALSGIVARIEEIREQELMVKISVGVLGKKIYFFRPYHEVDPARRPAKPSVRPIISVRPLSNTVQPGPSAAEQPMLPKAEVKALNIQLAEINREFIKYLAMHPNAIYEIQPRRFELLVAELLTDMGYEVELTPETHDGGRDILAVMNLPLGKILTLVECKRYRPDRKVGIDIVRQFLWVLDREDRASCGVIATSSYFSAEAAATQDEHKWRLALRDFESLREWLGQYGTWTRSSTRGIWVPTLPGRSLNGSDQLKTKKRGH